MAEYPALPLFTDAYIADTRHLTTIQHGAYLLMLMTAWRMPECALPDDDVFLSRICGMDKRTWTANKHVVLSFWKKDINQNWYQGRLKDERKYVAQVRNKNVAAGKASALKRLNRESTSVSTKSQPKSNPHTHTHTKKKEKDTNVSQKSVRNYTPEFEELWKEYPRHDSSNSDAFKSYKKAIADGITNETILNAVKRFAKHHQALRTENRYIPHASTWLSRKSWEIAYEIPKAAGDKPKCKMPTQTDILDELTKNEGK